MARINITDVTNNPQIVEDTDGDLNVTGTGYFEILMNSINKQIKSQYDSGRIRGEDYAQVYMAMMQAALAQSMQFTLSKDKAETDVELLEAQKAKLAAETALVGTQNLEIQANGEADREIKAEQALNEADKRLSTAKAREVQESQRRLYERQILGFDDNKNIKAFESQLNSWALLHSSGMIESITLPSVIAEANLTATYNELTRDTPEGSL